MNPSTSGLHNLPARPALLTALLLAAALTSPACGDEKTFDAEEFVREANEAGAGFELGEPLSTSDEGAELYALRIEEAGSATRPAPGDPELHGGGSLKVTESADAARKEFERCEEAVSLVCYRAANIAVYFDGITPEQQSRVGQAFQAIGED